VADMARPIALGLTEARLYDGLLAVTNLFNDPDLWEEFIDFSANNA
jgi:hypothetical protein